MQFHVKVEQHTIPKFCRLSPSSLGDCSGEADTLKKSKSAFDGRLDKKCKSGELDGGSLMAENKKS